jgi:hypothetical protein
VIMVWQRGGMLQVLDFFSHYCVTVSSVMLYSDSGESENSN